MLTASAEDQALTGLDRRQFQRVKVNLHARFMTEDRSEHNCIAVEMSPATATFASEYPVQDGERIVAYIDHIGRVEGMVLRAFEGGFAADLNTSARKREKLDLPEDRRHERLVPKNPQTTLVLSDGRQYRCRLLDLSLSGAAVSIAVRPALGTQVTIGNMRGSVVRHFDDGIAIEFAFVQRREALSSYLD